MAKTTDSKLPAEPLKIVAVNGSLRESGNTIHALQALVKMLEQRGADVRVLDLRLVELPLFRPDRPDPVAQKRVAMDMDWADAVVLATPDYHGSMSGALKNFLDYSWSECAGKLFAYLCVSHEKGLTVMDQMRVVVRQCYGWSLPYGVSFDARSDMAKDGAIAGTRLERRLKMMARDVLVYGALLRSQFVDDLGADEAETFAAAYRKKAEA